MALQIIQPTTLLLLLLVTGVFWGPWLALHRSLHSFTKAEFIKITKILAANLGLPMKILMPLCNISLLLSMLFFPDKGSLDFYLLVLSFACSIITLIVTMATELPIVNQIKRWTPDSIPADWEVIRDKWIKFHALRVFPAIISFILFMAAVLHTF